MANEIRLQFEMTEDEFEREKVAARKTKGLKIEGVEGIESSGTYDKGGMIDFLMANPQVLVTLLSSIATITTQLYNFIQGLRKRPIIEPGIRIDLQTNPPRVSTSNSIPPRTVVIIDKRGNEIKYDKAIEKEEDLVPIVTMMQKPPKKRKPVKKERKAVKKKPSASHKKSKRRRE